MARQDRSIQDREEIIQIIEECQVIRVAMQDEAGIYVVPMNYGYIWENGTLVFYLHGALEGRKTRALEKQPVVGFELDCSHALVEGKLPCQYGYKFASVIGNGRAVIVEDPREKMEALTILMRHVSGKEFAFNEKLVSIVSVIRLTAEEFTGRARR